MPRRVLILLTLLAWCCLAVPWMACGSDCREGSVQPVFHHCHSVEHHSCESGQARSACHAGVEDDGDVCERHEEESHQTLVFQQTTPEPIDLPVFEPTLIAVIDYQPWVARHQAARPEEVIDPPVDPPGWETQASVQLRTDVLLR